MRATGQVASATSNACTRSGNSSRNSGSLGSCARVAGRYRQKGPIAATDGDYGTVTKVKFSARPRRSAGQSRRFWLTQFVRVGTAIKQGMMQYAQRPKATTRRARSSAPSDFGRVEVGPRSYQAMRPSTDPGRKTMP